jgi:hypothetical protein
VRSRLIAALAALVAAVGAVVWALVAPGVSARPAASASDGITWSASPSPSGSPSVSANAQETQAVATAGMHLVFNQSFLGKHLNKAAWGTCYPWMDVATGCSNFGNKEYEWYLPSQDSVRAGSLHLAAQPKATHGKKKSGAAKLYACRSGMITSYPSLRFKYGYLSVVARIPDKPGLWSALWLAAANKQWPPEIDILERWGQPRNVAGVYLHTKASRKHAIEVHLTPEMTATLADGWHTFSILWTASQVTWYVDGQQIMVVRHQIPHQLMYLILNLADFQAVPGGCNGQLLIRSVQVWQKPAG